MKTILFSLLAAALLAGCETVEDMREILDTQEQLRGMVEEEIGLTPLVGFNTNDGVLIDVSFALSADEVADRNVSELVHAARKAVAGTFEDKPRAIYIQLVTAPLEDI